jgi:hypothetical protein
MSGNGGNKFLFLFEMNCRPIHQKKRNKQGPAHFSLSSPKLGVGVLMISGVAHMHGDATSD